MGAGQRQHGETPINNQAQNKQANSIAKKFKMTKNQKREFHDEITGQGMSYAQMLEIAEDIVNKNKE